MKLTERAEEILETMWIAIEEEGRGFVDLESVGVAADDPAIRELIGQALEIADGNQSLAAKKLSLGIDAFRYRMKKFGYLS